MARALRKGLTLIREYLKLVNEAYESKEEIRTYLRLKGVKI
jgi:ribosomal protein S19